MRRLICWGTRIILPLLLVHRHRTNLPDVIGRVADLNLIVPLIDDVGFLFNAPVMESLNGNVERYDDRGALGHGDAFASD